MSRTRSMSRWSFFFTPMCALACVALAGIALAGGDDPLRVSEFAYGRVITAPSTRALQSLNLDLDVYRRSAEAGLADLRVFDARGEPVPHAIRLAPPAPAREARLEPLPVFRLDAGARASALQKPAEGSSLKHAEGSSLKPAEGSSLKPAEGSSLKPAEGSSLKPAEGSLTGGYEIDAEISETGAILRLRGPVQPLPGPATGGTWLVDASSLGVEPVIGLELDLAPSAGDFVAHLRVDATDDLTHFRTRVPHAAIARFSQGGHQIERLDLGMPSTRARYLRLTLVDGVLPADLQGVGARIATPPSPPERERTRLSGSPVAGEPGTFVFDVAADLPIERIDVLPGEPNTLLEIHLDSAPAAKGPWTTRHTGLVYRLESGGTLRSAPIAWRGGDSRWLRVRVSPKGGGQQQARPEVELEWRPAQLVFMARGEGPFTLAYGKRGAPDTAFEASRIVRLAGDDLARLDETTATLGPPIRLAGELAYQPPPKPIAWRQIVLWSVLVLTVGGVLWMSVRLLGGAGREASVDGTDDAPGTDRPSP